MSWLGEALTKTANWVGDVMNRATGQTQANQWQWDMWNAQNEYNSPAAQRARLEAAGYNPMLMGSVGSSASGNAGSMTAKSGAGISPFEIMNSLVNAQISLEQADYVAEQTRKLRHDNNLVEGLPIKSDDNSFLGKIGRFMRWTGTEQGKEVVDEAKKKVGGIFQGAAVPLSPARQVQDSLRKKVNRELTDDLFKIRRRPGERLDAVMHRADMLSNKLNKSPKKNWNGGKRGRYSHLAP